MEFNSQNQLLVKFVIMNNKQQHWENIFEKKSTAEMSWTETYPSTSMDLINNLEMDKSLPVIDIGGGDSKLVDALLENGYNDISVLDISKKALERAQIRLGEHSKRVSWIVSDVLNFKPQKSYALWHDRASFHFLIDSMEIESYTNLVSQWVNKHLVIGTFSVNGPLKCSGLPISQYSCKSILKNFEEKFKSIECKSIIHNTPFDTKQDFIFSSFDKKL